MDLDLRWHSFLIPGLFFMVIGNAAVAAWGLGPLQLGALVAGFFLLLAAVLKALSDRQEESGAGDGT